MPKYRITSPDGKTFEITAPEGATQEQVLSYAQSQWKAPKTEKAPDPTEGMSGFDKFAAGAGKAVYDIGRGAGQMLGLVSDQDVAEARRRDEALMNTGAGMAGNIAGNVITALPTAAIPGVNTVLGGAAIGAGMGALQPTIADESRLQNMALGGVAGGVLPAIVGGVKTAKAALYDPLAGQERIIGGALKRSAGDKAAEIAKALRSQGAATPGVRLSAGQVGTSEGLSALEDAITSALPSGELARMGQTNRTALADALRGIAGSPESLNAAKTARGDTAGKLYELARAQGVDMASLAPEAQANIAAFQQRVPEDILNRAKELAKISGVNMDNESAIQGMHWVKTAIDSKIGQAVTSGDKEMARAYQGLQDDLITGMGQISPAYDTARKTFQQMSGPVNQMKVGQALANKLIPATAGDVPASLNYSSLATAMRNPDQIAQRATGFSGAKMGSILSPEQMGTVQGVTSDASRIAEALKRGSGNNSATHRRFTQGDMLAQHFAQEAPITSKILELASNLPGVGFVGKGVSLAGSVVGDKVKAQMLGQLDDMLANNPQQVAKLIEKELARVEPSQRQQIIRALPQSVVLSLPAAYVSQK
jgi:hypothetical protein